VTDAISELSQAHSCVTYQAKTEDRLCTTGLQAQIKIPDMTATVVTWRKGTVSGERRPTNAQGCCKQFFIVLNKLPRHVSTSKCHLQGVTLSFNKLLQFFSLRFKWVWAIVHSVRPSAAEAYCNPLKMAFGSRNMSG
jgi:hypothetical protein